MENKKMSVDVAASTDKVKDNSVGIISNPHSDYITYSGKITRERCDELIDLVIQFNETVKNCNAHIGIDNYCMHITIAYEYGRYGYGHYEHYYSYDDVRLEAAEQAIRKVLEQK